MNDKERRQYWEDYTQYWQEKIVEADDKTKKNDHRVPGHEIIDTYFEKLQVSRDDKFLDFGCGSCRLYERYRMDTNNSDNYYGVDIAQCPLDIAIGNYPNLENYLQTTNGDNIPFKDDFFDKIICFGVFDACTQEKTIFELLRVLKKGGQLLVTGKNYRYYEDDEEAAIAEIKAREKGHPNFFTDVDSMINMLEYNNIKISDSYYFLRRGDFARNEYYKEMPNKFYEWALILQKQDTIEFEVPTKFSHIYSDTYTKKQKGI